MDSRARRATLNQTAKLVARCQERTAAAANNAAIIFTHIGIDDRWRPAIGAGEMFGRPYAAGHPTNMRGAPPIFQYRTLPQLMTHYPRKGLAPVWGLLPINLRPHRPTKIVHGLEYRAADHSISGSAHERELTPIGSAA